MNKIIPAARLGLLFAAGVCTAILVTPAWAEQTSYRLKQTATVDGPNILAADVLEPEPQGSLAQVVLGRVGAPGSTRDLTIEQVSKRIFRSARLRPAIDGSRCLVTASVQELSGSDLVNFAEEYLRDQLRDLSSTAKLSIEPGREPRDQKVPGRQTTLRIDSAARAKLRGNVVLTVKALQEDSKGNLVVAATVPVTFRVSVKEPVLVATKPIRRREAISAANAAMEMRDTTYSRGEPYHSLGEVEGLRAARSLAAGTLILQEHLDLPPLIRKGDQVWLQVLVGGVQLEVPAIAREDGRQDEMIQVEIQDKKKKMTARVVNAGLVVAGIGLPPRP